MKKIFYLLIILPLAFYMQEVFSSAFTGGTSYYIPSPSSRTMQNSNNRLRSEVLDYNQSLSAQLETIQRNPAQNYPCEFLQEEKNEFQTPVPWGPGNNQKQQIQQHQQNEPSNNTLQIQRENPKWWRQENSYQGWGFN